MSVWDTLRNYPGGDEYGHRASERYRYARRDGRAAYVFTEAEVWDGLWEQTQSRRTPNLQRVAVRLVELDQGAGSRKCQHHAGCSGGSLAEGWGHSQRRSCTTPQCEGRTRTFRPFRLPGPGRSRFSMPRPRCDASASWRTFLIWAWKEHGLVADRMGESPSGSVIMLFDEVESHLHPRWQRTILGSLRNLGDVLLDNTNLQLVVTTHSPLVMASAEAWFDPSRTSGSISIWKVRPRAPSCGNVTTCATAARVRGSPAKPSTWRPIVEVSRREEAIVRARALAARSQTEVGRRHGGRMKGYARRSGTWTRSGCAGTHSSNAAAESFDSYRASARTAGVRPHGPTARIAGCRGTGRGGAATARGQAVPSGCRLEGRDSSHELPALLVGGARRSPGCLRSGLRLPLRSNLDRSHRRPLRREVPALGSGV